MSNEDVAEKISIRISEFSTSRAFDVELENNGTVGALKKVIAQDHKLKPAPNLQRLVLLGKPLNDDSAIVSDLIRAKGIDPCTKTTVHLVISEPAAAQSRASGATSTPAPAPARQAANATNSTSASRALPTSESQPTQVPPSPGPQAPTTAGVPMMHPIMAAAYNAALVELSNSACNAQRTAATITGANGRQHTVPFALSAPLHMSELFAQQQVPGPPYRHMMAPEQSIVINTNSVHLNGNGSESLASLLSRANVRMRVVPGGARGAAGAPQNQGQQRANIIPPAAGAPNAQGQRPVAAWQFQFQFHINFMYIARLVIGGIFMHFVFQIPIYQVVLILLGAVIFFQVIALRLHSYFTRLLDAVIAYTQQPFNPPQQHAAAQVRDAGGEPGAGGVRQNRQRPNQRLGFLWQVWVGVLSFFLSILPQFNANQADAAAIGAAQEELNNAPPAVGI